MVRSLLFRVSPRVVARPPKSSRRWQALRLAVTGLSAIVGVQARGASKSPETADQIAPAPAAIVRADDNPFEQPGAVTPAGRIDELVFTQLARLGVEPAHLCSDSVFVRRVFLDVIGTLPTPSEVRQFIQDPSPTKRGALIDRLLDRDEFADYWTMKWCDLLRVKAEFPVNLWPNAAQAYHRWIYTAIRDNLPYDQFVRTLLTSSGSNFRTGPVNFYRATPSRDPQAIVRIVALTFMGERTDHWSPEQIAGMTPLFSAIGYKSTQEWKEEIVFFDPAKIPAAGLTAVLPPSNSKLSPGASSASLRITSDRDPREQFAEWLIRPDNPRFTRPIVNRAWSWLLGRGIVHAPDDLRPDNPPSNPDLLAYLERQFVADKYDLKRLFRRILNSHTYQLSSIARSASLQAEANFASYPLRRLDAEVLIDALNQITGTTEKYSSAIPEPFTFIPEDQRSIALPDGSITSSFLEMFGRAGRDTGEESERNNRITATQRLHLLNSTHVQRKIEQGPKLQALLGSRRPAPEIVSDLYLAILSREPTAHERAAVLAHAQSTNPRNAAVDTAWALINSAEFLYRH